MSGPEWARERELRGMGEGNRNRTDDVVVARSIPAGETTVEKGTPRGDAPFTPWSGGETVGQRIAEHSLGRR
jgi:hypothetical protein